MSDLIPSINRPTMPPPSTEADKTIMGLIEQIRSQPNIKIGDSLLLDVMMQELGEGTVSLSAKLKGETLQVAIDKRLDLPNHPVRAEARVVMVEGKLIGINLSTHLPISAGEHPK